MPFIFRRLFELFGVGIVLSVIITVLGGMQIIASTHYAGIILAGAQILFNLVFQFFALRAYHRRFRRWRGIYFRTNLFATSMFMMAAMFFSLTEIEPLFTYMFMPFKFFYYCFHIEKFISALLVGLLYILEVPLVSAVISAKKKKLQKNIFKYI